MNGSANSKIAGRRLARRVAAEINGSTISSGGWVTRHRWEFVGQLSPADDWERRTRRVGNIGIHLPDVCSHGAWLDGATKFRGRIARFSSANRGVIHQTRPVQCR
jgi:hypothetical protein